jgi:hypothetical protein
MLFDVRLDVKSDLNDEGELVGWARKTSKKHRTITSAISVDFPFLTNWEVSLFASEKCTDDKLFEGTLHELTEVSIIILLCKILPFSSWYSLAMTRFSHLATEMSLVA